MSLPRFLRNLRKTARYRRSKRSLPRRPLLLETLQAREMLAADITLADGVLTIRGSSAADQVEVSYTDEGRLSVEVAGQDTHQLDNALNEISKIVIYGYEGDDRLTNSTSIIAQLHGGVGDDVLTGGSGDDTIYGNEGHDTIYGMAGDDLIYGDTGNDRIYAGDGNDRVYGWYGDDYITGQAGNDTIVGGQDNDTLYGYTGDDFIYGHTGDDWISGGAGNDYISGYDGNDTLYGYTGDDVISAGAGDDFLSGWDGEDRLYGHDGNDRIFGGADRDIIYGHAGDDAMYAGDGDDYVFGGDGADIVEGQVGNDYLVGGNGNDKLYGWLGDDRIYGDAGDDYLSGWEGHDVLLGGEGNDRIHGNTGSDVLYGNGGNDHMYGGDGVDSLYGDDGNDLVDGGADDDLVRGGNDNDTVYGYTGNDRLYGDAGDDYLSGWEGDDQLYGGDGNDSLSGHAGADALFGNDGDDKMYGGDGNDRLFGDDGRDLLDGGADDDLASGGNENDTIYGYTGNDRLYGDAGDDYLSGWDGDDLLFGGPGNDRLTGQAGADSVNGNDGNDFLSGGDDADVLSGGAGDDELRGDAGADSLWGHEGNDTIRGGEGDDSISGMEGEDFLYGDSGNDTIYGGAGNDVILAGDGNDRLYGGDGQDVLEGQAGHDLLRGGNDNDKLYGWTGDDVLYGDEGDDYLSGWEGNDTLHGGAGHDSLRSIKGANRVEGGSGNDQLISYGSGTTFVFAGSLLGHDVIRSGEADYFTGQGDTLDFSGMNAGIRITLPSFDHSSFTSVNRDLGLQLGGRLHHVIGTAYDDIIIGNAQANTIQAGGGNDLISTQHGDNLIDQVDVGSGQDWVVGDVEDTVNGGSHDDHIVAGQDGEFTSHVLTTLHPGMSFAVKHRSGGALSVSRWMPWPGSEGSWSDDAFRTSSSRFERLDGPFWIERRSSGADSHYIEVTQSKVQLSEFSEPVTLYDMDRNLFVQLGEDQARWRSAAHDNHLATVRDSDGEHIVTTAADFVGELSVIAVSEHGMPSLSFNLNVERPPDHHDTPVFALRDLPLDGNDDRVTVTQGDLRTFVLQTGTPLHETGENFQFETADYNDDGHLDVFAIKKSSTGTHSTEIHVLDGASNYQRYLLQTGTILHETGSSFDFELADYNGDKVPDLFAISKSATGSDSTEVHILDGASGYQRWLLQTGTPLHETGSNFEFEVADWTGDKVVDLLAIKKSATGTNSTEIHVLDGSRHFQNWVMQTGTPLHETGDNFEFEAVDWDHDGHTDIVALKKSATGTFSTEVHVLSGGSNFQRYIDQLGTGLHETGEHFDLAIHDWNGDRIPDLVAIKKDRTGTDSTEVHVISGGFTAGKIYFRSGGQFVYRGTKGNDTINVLPVDEATFRLEVTLENGNRAYSDVYSFDAFNEILIVGDGGHDQITNHTARGIKLNGSSGNDTLRGGAGDDWLMGGSGNDILFGGAGSDRLTGGQIGVITGESDDDRLYGESGNDTYYVGTSAFGNDLVFETGGIDTFDLSALSSAVSVNLKTPVKPDHRLDIGNRYVLDGPGVYSQLGTIRLQEAESVENVIGTAYDDQIYGSDKANTIHGGDGNDWIGGGRGDDVLHGEDGWDNLWGDEGNDHLLGGPGNDNLHGSAITYDTAESNDDVLDGGPDNDTLQVTGGSNIILTGSGLKDRVYTGGYPDSSHNVIIDLDGVLIDSSLGSVDKSYDSIIVGANAEIEGTGNDTFVSNGSGGFGLLDAVTDRQAAADRSLAVISSLVRSVGRELQTEISLLEIEHDRVRDSFDFLYQGNTPLVQANDNLDAALSPVDAISTHGGALVNAGVLANRLSQVMSVINAAEAYYYHVEVGMYDRVVDELVRPSLERFDNVLARVEHLQNRLKGLHALYITVQEAAYKEVVASPPKIIGEVGGGVVWGPVNFRVGNNEGGNPDGQLAFHGRTYVSNIRVTDEMKNRTWRDIAMSFRCDDLDVADGGISHTRIFVNGSLVRRIGANGSHSFSLGTAILNNKAVGDFIEIRIEAGMETDSGDIDEVNFYDLTLRWFE